MIKASSLEKFDTPIVIINQAFEGEDWGVVTSFMSNQEESDDCSMGTGWNVSVTLPNLDDVEFTQLFSTPEAALEFGISQILSGSLRPVTCFADGPQSGDHLFGSYKSVA